MVATLKISDADMLELRQASVVHNRSIAGQAEYWMRLGRAAERNPDMTLSRVEQALRGLQDPADLNGAEQEQFFDRLGEFMDRPNAPIHAFFAEMNRKSEGLVLDEDENVIADNRVQEKA